MTLVELFALLTSHLVVGTIGWLHCRKRYVRVIGAMHLNCQDIEAESDRNLARLREVRDQFRALEQSLIHVQLLMERAQERVAGL